MPDSSSPHEPIAGAVRATTSGQRSRRQQLNDVALLAANLVLVTVSLASLRRDGVDIAPLVAVASAVIAFTLLMFWRRHRNRRRRAGAGQEAGR